MRCVRALLAIVLFSKAAVQPLFDADAMSYNPQNHEQMRPTAHPLVTSLDDVLEDHQIAIDSAKGLSPTQLAFFRFNDLPAPRRSLR